MKTRQGVRDLNLIGPRRPPGARVPRYPTEKFCAHTAMNVWDAAVNKIIGTKCSMCNKDLSGDLSGKAGDL